MRIITSLIPALLLTLVTTGGASAHSFDETAPAPRSHHGRAVKAQLAKIHDAVMQYRDPTAAIAGGWIPSDTCVDIPGGPGMGYHYVKPTVIGSAPDINHPAVLVYVPTRHGKLTLGAVEWFAADPDQDLSTDAGRPDFVGVPFVGPMLGHEPGMPIHFDLHAWLFKRNSAGMFAAFNPRVSCTATDHH